MENFKDKHYYNLDLLRGLSGYGVAVCHFYAFLHDNKELEFLSFLFVEFFFVLSGYVLYPQLISVLKNSKNLLIFYKRRWLRTIPLYVITLIMVSIIFEKTFSIDFFKYLIFIQNISPDFLNKNYYPIVWSLSIEEFFYLTFPLILIYFNKENFFKNIVLLLILFTIIKLIAINFFDSNFARTGTFFRFDAIYIGFLARHLYEKINSKYFLFSILIISLFILFKSELYILENKEIYLIKTLFVYFLQFISVVTLYFFISIEGYFNYSLFKNFFTLISRQTYSVYLIHMIFIYIFQKLEMSYSLEFLFYLFFLACFSTFLYYFVEKPILKIRPKLLK